MTWEEALREGIENGKTRNKRVRVYCVQTVRCTCLGDHDYRGYEYYSYTLGVTPSRRH